MTIPSRIFLLSRRDNGTFVPATESTQEVPTFVCYFTEAQAQTARREHILKHEIIADVVELNVVP